MTVKSILKLATGLLNRKDLLSYLNGESVEDEERVKSDIDTLVVCYNVVAEEISTVYTKVVYTQKLTVTAGVLKYNQFTYNPVKILSVKDVDGNEIACTILPTELRTNTSRIVVEYTYIPPKLKLEDNSDFTNTEVKERVLGYGIVTEFCLIKGMYEEAVLWHDKYVTSLKNTLSNKKLQKIKGRVWW